MASGTYIILILDVVKLVGILNLCIILINLVNILGGKDNLVGVKLLIVLIFNLLEETAYLGFFIFHFCYSVLIFLSRHFWTLESVIILLLPIDFYLISIILCTVVHIGVWACCITAILVIFIFLGIFIIKIIFLYSIFLIVIFVMSFLFILFSLDKKFSINSQSGWYFPRLSFLRIPIKNGRRFSHILIILLYLGLANIVNVFVDLMTILRNTNLFRALLIFILVLEQKYVVLFIFILVA